MSVFCQCCLNKCDDQVNMSSPVNNQGILEVYEEMLQYSTGIQLQQDDNIHYICNICICRLRESCIFKNQVEEIQWRLSINALNNHIKKEPDIDDTILENTNSESDTDNDNEKDIVLNVSSAKPAKPKTKMLLSKCKRCSLTFNNKKEYDAHRKTCNTSFICPHCGKTFERKSRFKAHLNTHGGKVQCEVCNKFIAEYNLKTHITNSHNGGLMYTCKKCPERFNGYHKRQKHMVEVHGAEQKKYPCSYCPRIFNSSSLVQKHIRRDHLLERKHSCTSCAKSFYDKTDLNQHMLIHTGDKKFECDICHKSLSKKTTLTEHLKIHYNIKDQKCHICGSAFTQKCSLAKHLKTHK